MLNKYDNGEKDFNAYITRSKTSIYDLKTKRKYTHFELLKRLKNDYYEYIKDEIEKLKSISNKQIEEIVYKIPDDFMNDKNKNFIIKYLEIIKEKILKMFE